jgi:hypothetical protein
MALAEAPAGCSGVTRLLSWVGASVVGAVGWWAGAPWGILSAFLLSMVGTGAGLFLGRWLADRLVE